MSLGSKSFSAIFIEIELEMILLDLDICKDFGGFLMSEILKAINLCVFINLLYDLYYVTCISLFHSFRHNDLSLCLPLFNLRKRESLLHVSKILDQISSKCWLYEIRNIKNVKFLIQNIVSTKVFLSELLRAPYWSANRYWILRKKENKTKGRLD